MTELNLPYAACEVIVALCAALGNGLVIIVFAKERKLRRRTNYYIISLATADLLVGLFAIPFAILASIGQPTNLYACLFTVSVLVVLCTISIFCLVAVSVDRYWAILHPMGYSRTVRTKTAIGIICVCWAAGTLVGFLPLLGWNAGHKSDEKCIFTEVMDYDYLVFLYFATIIFPALIIAAFYAHIYRVVVKQLQQIVTMNPGKRKENQTHGTMLRLLGAAQKREVKATQNLSRIVVFFIVCWFPLYTINCVMAFCPQCEVNQFLINFCIILSHLNSAGNPLLYAYHLKDFRAALKNFIHKILFPGRNDAKDTLGGLIGSINIIQEPRGSITGTQRGFVGKGHVIKTHHQLLQGGSSSINKQTSLLRQVQESKLKEIQAISSTEPITNPTNKCKEDTARMIFINNNNNDKEISLPISPVSILGFNGQCDGANSNDSVSGSSISTTRSDCAALNASVTTSTKEATATSTTMINATITTTAVTSTVELRLYDFEATLRFADCDEDEDDEDEDDDDDDDDDEDEDEDEEDEEDEEEEEDDDDDDDHDHDHDDNDEDVKMTETTLQSDSMFVIEADINRTLSSGERLTLDLEDGQTDNRSMDD